MNIVHLGILEQFIVWKISSSTHSDSCRWGGREREIGTHDECVCVALFVVLGLNWQHRRATTHLYVIIGGPGNVPSLRWGRAKFLSLTTKYNKKKKKQKKTWQGRKYDEQDLLTPFSSQRGVAEAQCNLKSRELLLLSRIWQFFYFHFFSLFFLSVGFLTGIWCIYSELLVASIHTADSVTSLYASITHI